MGQHHEDGAGGPVHVLQGRRWSFLANDSEDEDGEDESEEESAFEMDESDFGSEASSEDESDFDENASQEAEDDAVSDDDEGEDWDELEKKAARKDREAGRGRQGPGGGREQAEQEVGRGSFVGFRERRHLFVTRKEWTTWSQACIGRASADARLALISLGVRSATSLRRNTFPAPRGRPGVYAPPSDARFYFSRRTRVRKPNDGMRTHQAAAGRARADLTRWGGWRRVVPPEPQ